MISVRGTPDILVSFIASGNPCNVTIRRQMKFATCSAASNGRTPVRGELAPSSPTIPRPILPYFAAFHYVSFCHLPARSWIRQADGVSGSTPAPRQLNPSAPRHAHGQVRHLRAAATPRRCQSGRVMPAGSSRSEPGSGPRRQATT